MPMGPSNSLFLYPVPGSVSIKLMFVFQELTVYFLVLPILFHLKLCAGVSNAYIASVIYYQPDVAPCPASRLIKLVFRLLLKGRVPLVKEPICCQQPLRGGLRMLWRMIYRPATTLMLQHLKCVINGRFCHTKEFRIIRRKRRPRKDAFYQSGNAVGESFTMDFYRRFVKGRNNDVSSETLGVGRIN